MLVEILNKEEIRESIPIEISIKNSVGTPKVYVEGLGKMIPQKVKEGYLVSFWSLKEGQYTIQIKDQKHFWSEQIAIKKQGYLEFKYEFGLFLALLCLTFFTMAILAKRKK